MNRVQEAVPDQAVPGQVAPDRAAPDRAAPGQAAPDRRQRKKQLTKDALLEAALELFAANGYDRTAVHEIRRSSRCRIFRLSVTTFHSSRV